MSVRSRVLPVSLGAALMSALIAAACSEPASPPLATAEVLKVAPAASFCADGYPPPPPSDTSSTFAYDDGSTTMLDTEVRFLPAANVASTAGYVLEPRKLSVQTTFMVNDANGNGFISFDKVPSIISANARINLRDCIPTSGQGTITLPHNDGGKIVFDLRALGAVKGTASLCGAMTRVGCFDLYLSGGQRYDAGGALIDANVESTFTLGVPCNYTLEKYGVCTVPIVKEAIG